MEYLFKCKSITHPFLGEKDNPKLKAMYKQNLQDCITRGEQIKDLVSKGTKKKAVKADGGSKKDSDDEEDKDNNKLKEQLKDSIVH